MNEATPPTANCGACKCRPVETTNSIAFEVPGLPVPKARARVTRAGITYTPRETLNYEAQVRVAYANAYPGRQPFAAATALVLQLEAHFPLPAGAPKRLRRQMEAGTTTPMTQRPDLDNLVKTVLDALNRVAWADDGQVAEIMARKRRTVGVPRLRVCIAELAAVPARTAQAPQNAAHPHGATAESQSGTKGRCSASAPDVSADGARQRAVAAPVARADGANVLSTTPALGPSRPSESKDPTGNTSSVPFFLFW